MSEDELRANSERLWNEYARFLSRWDDITVARWLAQTLAQISGGIWRNSHPFIGALRLAASEAWSRGLKLSRHVTVPHEFGLAECCGHPLVPVFTRDVMDQGLICMFCGGKAFAFEDLEVDQQRLLASWAKPYQENHDVAHWPDERRRPAQAYEQIYNEAAEKAETMLVQLALEVLPSFVERFPAIVWEDADECLDVRPDDLSLDPEGSDTDV